MSVLLVGVLSSVGLWRPHSMSLETCSLFKVLVRIDALIHGTKLKNKSQGSTLIRKKKLDYWLARTNIGFSNNYLSLVYSFD